MISYISFSIILLSIHGCFVLEDESISDDKSSLEGDEAVESDDSECSTESHDEFGKLTYWAKKHFAHYRPRLLPDYV